MDSRNAVLALLSIAVVILAAFSAFELSEVSDLNSRNASLTNQVSSLSSQFNRLLAEFPNSSQVAVTYASLVLGIGYSPTLATAVVTNNGTAALHDLRTTLIFSPGASFGLHMNDDVLLPRQATFVAANVTARCQPGVDYALLVNATTDSGSSLTHVSSVICTGWSLSPLAVVYDDVIDVGAPLHLPFATNVWRMGVGNGGIFPIGVAIQLLINGQPAYLGDSYTLPIGKTGSSTYCSSFPARANSYELTAIVTNRTGTKTITFPATMINATKIPFLGQLSASASLVTVNDQYGHYTRWNMSITNNGQAPIQFLWVGLSNGTSLLRFFPIRCAGAQSPVPNFAVNYSQPVLQGQSAEYGEQIGLTASSGKSFTMMVLAVYADYSEVAETFELPIE